MDSTLTQLAQRLELDIRNRGLAPGHRYLTGAESARLLGTSLATANRAMQMLAEREIVVRRRNSGTFIGPAMTRVSSVDIRSISILVPASFRAFGIVKADALVEGILAHMADVMDVRVSYVPAEGDVEFTRTLLEPLRKSGQLAGVIAISGSYELYRYLGENDYPLVVMGSLYPGQTYASIDVDERQAGYLLTHHLVERGHRRLAMLSDSESRPGDHHFHDGVSEALTEAQLPHNALVLRAPGPNADVFRAQVEELLAMPDPPTGFMVRLPRWANEVAAVLQERGFRIPDEMEIVFKHFFMGPDASPIDFAHVRASLSYNEIAAIVGRMLSQVRQRLPLEQRTVTVPYQMCVSQQ